MSKKIARDEVFKSDKAPVSFAFNAQVADVFDDMIERSVPGYSHAQQLMARLCAGYAHAGSRVYDLGCSTGNTLEIADKHLADGVELVACDSSPDMLKRCRQRLGGSVKTRRVHYLLHDLEKTIELEQPSVVILSLVLHFIEPRLRAGLISSIYQQLCPGGALILFEKATATDSHLQQIFCEWHEGFKRAQGYSDLEIARKKQALENVLAPMSKQENLKLLKSGGFGHIEIFFSLANFFGVVAVKDLAQN
ncbi:MAG: carboxy-S-adenosyl-L-methionine synthase CmoA [Gammaproteobacteria bacterium]|nr:carboxy-S-adenosyl-L-methionine synthase CmoA [Gammaproteobacteria bacterium]